MTMLFLTNLDTFITNFVNIVLPHNLFFDYFFSFFSLRGNSILIWLILILIALVLEERKNPGIQKRDIKFVAIFLLTFTLSFITSDIILKNLIKRPRPDYYNTTNSTYAVEPGLAQCPKNYSFPSSHATTAVAAATVITSFDKKRKWLYFGVAILISLSRVYLSCHFFFDVAVGGIVGYLNSIFILKLIKSDKYHK